MRLFVIALMPLVAYTLPAAPATNSTLYDENLASFLLEMSNLAYCDHQVATWTTDSSHCNVQDASSCGL